MTLYSLTHITLGVRCKTPCIFPFKHLGKTHHKCTYDDRKTSDHSFKAWCATKVDGNGIVEVRATCETLCPTGIIIHGK